MQKTRLELVTRDTMVSLDDTQDHSSTRLQLTLDSLNAWAPGELSAELTVTDVQLLAGSLLEWLADMDHALPDLPVDGLEQYPDEDEDSRPLGAA